MFGKSRDIGNRKPLKPAPPAPKAKTEKSAATLKTTAAPAAALASEKPAKPEPPKISKADQEKQEQYYELKARLHRKLVDQLDITRGTGEESDLRDQVRELVVALVNEENILLNFNEKQRLIEEVLDETFGLGPLEALLTDPSISDILINGPKTCYVERKGKLELTGIQFRDNQHLMHVIDKIVSAVGRRCDETTPLVDARLKDGSRVNAVIPPLAIDGA